MCLIRHLKGAGLVVGVLVLCATPLQAGILLEWRPTATGVTFGQTVDVKLFAVSDTGAVETVFGLNVILAWDSTRLQLLENVDPCVGGSCPPNGFDWITSEFPPNSDGLNDTFTDGRALYAAFGFTDPNAADATPEGLWVTTFRFQTLAPGLADLHFEATFGTTSTAVAGGDRSLLPVALGPAAQVAIVDCPSPDLVVLGPRYLGVTPAAGTEPVALSVDGDAADTSVDCVSLFVQADGTLGPVPFQQIPSAWGTINVADGRIRPGTTYSVRAVCGVGTGLDVRSDPAVTVTTWNWGDVNGDGAANIFDLNLVSDGAQGTFQAGTVLENLDLSPCLPDRFIDDADVEAVRQATAGMPFSCAVPCPTGWSLDDFLNFEACMDGPLENAPTGCDAFDTDFNGAVDMLDFRSFQATFGPP